MTRWANDPHRHHRREAHPGVPARNPGRGLSAQAMATLLLMSGRARGKELRGATLSDLGRHSRPRRPAGGLCER